MEERIAVTGINGRFPGAENVDQFWENLCDGVESISQLSTDTLLKSGFSEADIFSGSYVAAKGLLKDYDCFDANYFDISPREAALVDPQQRLFLEAAAAVLDDGGYGDPRFRPCTGVFAGSGFNTYFPNVLFNGSNNTKLSDIALMVGNACDYLTTRVSYKLGLSGPSVTVQTACSTSLVAVHLASQSLLSGECDMALAGGVNVIVPQVAGHQYIEGGILSPDGHCRPFDQSANGTVNGCGVGVVLLRRYDDALADRDHIYAVILGSAVNNNASTAQSFTAPSSVAETSAISEALSVSEIDTDTLDYIEAHATGTRLGDAVEVVALEKALPGRSRPCWIGSVKGNIGHLNACAGIASLIKTILALKNKKIPPSININELNPECAFENNIFQVNTELIEWPTDCGAASAGVSAFGFGGTNVHMILQEVASTSKNAVKSFNESTPQLICLQAHSKEALNTTVKLLGDYLSKRPSMNIADIAYTLQVGRKALPLRKYFVVNSTRELTQSCQLESESNYADSRLMSGLIFVFSSEKSDVEISYDYLYQNNKVFRESIDEVDIALREIMDISLVSSCSEQADNAILANFFAYQYALARLWINWGAAPAALFGEGIGELVALAVAQALTIDEAIKALATRQYAFGTEVIDNSKYAIVRKDQLASIERGSTDDSLVMLEIGFSASNAVFHDLKEERDVTLIRTLPESRAIQHRGDLLDIVGRLWCSGVQLNWPSVCVESHCRVSLPSYPFSRIPHWADSQVSVNNEFKQENNPTVNFWVPSWQRGGIQIPEKQVGEHYLIICDDQSLLAYFEGYLQKESIKVTSYSLEEVSAGIQHVSSDNIDELADRRKEAWSNLFIKLLSDKASPNKLIFIACLKNSTSVDEQRETVSSGLQHYWSIASSIADLVSAGHIRRDLCFQVNIVTASARDVLGGDSCQPSTAAIGALRLVISQETNVECRQIDIDANLLALEDYRQVIPSLATEIASVIDYPWVALRGNYRWFWTIGPISPVRPGGTTLKTGGVYLVTGGQGGIASVLGEYLANNYSARLVFLVRPNSEDADTLQRLSQTRLLLDLGADVIYEEADIRDLEAVKTSVIRAVKSFGPINGVLHTAAVNKSKPLTTQRYSGVETTYQTKVQGAKNIITALEQHNLGHSPDFVLLLSSVVGSFGFSGQFAYTAANAGLDAYAEWAADKTGWQVQSLVLDRVPGIGMAKYRGDNSTAAKNTHNGQLRYDNAGSQNVAGIEVGQLLHIFETAIGMEKIPVLLAMDGDPYKRLEERKKILNKRRQNPPVPPDKISIEGVQNIQSYLLDIVGTELGIVDMGCDEDFFYRGGDSILALNVVSTINEAILGNSETNLNPEDIYEFPTIDELSKKIDEVLSLSNGQCDSNPRENDRRERDRQPISTSLPDEFSDIQLDEVDVRLIVSDIEKNITE
jgi:3-oxoacyl-(acyl-carrier-protein) synthase/NAD(P)-dependent dehydrogenase (short-subunit alcohol dehydrogenase family)